MNTGIGVIGGAPVSSAKSAGLSEWVSVMRGRPSGSASGDSGKYDRAYVTTRGIIINKDFLKGNNPDLSKGYYFQFNPESIEDSKETNYESRNYVGMAYNDYIWSNGGERTISFQLFLDNTPQSHTSHFRPDSRGSKLASSLVFDEKKQRSSDGTLSWEEHGAFSHSRINERGVLDDVENIQSFLYPAPLVGETTPKFAEGGIVSPNQFRPPATAVLAIGPLYLEGIVRSAPVNYTLFDADLTPIRATINLSFSVFEYQEVERKISWSAR